MRVVDRNALVPYSAEAMYGLVDDVEFSRHFAGVRLSRGHSSPRILTDLLSRGVERRLAERAIEDVVDHEGVDSLETARTVAEKRLGQLGDDLPPDKLKRRLLTFLARRGHRGWEVREMVGEVLRERGAADL